MLNEPETSLHPDLLAPLAGLITGAAQFTQVVVVSHSGALIEALAAGADVAVIDLVKDDGETKIRGQAWLDEPQWKWPTR